MSGPFLVPVPPLVAPVWERQSHESEVEHAAFLGWLCGGQHMRDWVAAANVSGLDPDTVRMTARRWAWDVRAEQWLAHAREVSREANAPLRAQLAEVQADRLRAAGLMVKLAAVELGKLYESASGTPAPTLDPRTLARFLAVSTPILEALRRQAEGLPAELAGEDGPDFSQLTADELETMRRLNAKAKAG